METKLKEIQLQELNEKEVLEIEGGTQRKDAKQSRWLELLWGMFTS